MPYQPSIYYRQSRQCFPQTPAKTSDTYFIAPDCQRPSQTQRRGVVPLTPILVQLPDKSAPVQFLLPTQQQQPQSTTNDDCAENKCPSSSKDWSSDPMQWGPHLWYYLHTAANNYPLQPSPEQQQGMKNWLCSLQWTIPCKNCSNHYSKYIEASRNQLDDVCANKDKLFAFLVDIHNKVNLENGKGAMSVEEAKKMYPVF